MCKLIDVKTNFNTEVRVADNKKEFVENIIDIARYCENILQIILFGSVLEERCTDDSDIDLMVVCNIQRSKLYRKKEYATFIESLHNKDDYTQIYDVICVNGLEELNRNRDKTQLYNDVMNRGKTIYMKEKQL